MKSKTLKPKPGNSSLVSRLRKIEGQLQGVTRMVNEGRNCPEILTQMSAVHSALKAASLQLLRNHLDGCLRSAVRSGKGEASLKEIEKLLGQFLR